MSRIKVLRMDNPQVKNITKLPMFRGRKLMARGVFSAVYEGSNPDTVLKLTLDHVGYAMLNDGVVAVKHFHFPKVVENHGCLGEVEVGCNKHHAYAFEMERLVPTSAGSYAKKLAKKLTKTVGFASGTVTSRNRKGEQEFSSWDQQTELILDEVCADQSLPSSIRDAMCGLRSFVKNYGQGVLDLHGGNFMQRPCGELVIIDPLLPADVWESGVNLFRQRGW